MARRIYPAVLVVAALLSYANSFSIPFLLDDLATIVDNPQIRSWPSPHDLFFTLPNTSVAGRPMALLSLAVNYALGGLDVGGYHLMNLAIHIGCGLLLFGIVRRTVGRDLVALAASLLWVVHPLTSEVVVYTVQRTESIMAFFYLLTFYAAMRSLTGTRTRTWQTIAVIACAFGMLSKESMATAPLLLILYERLFVFDSMRTAVVRRGGFYLALAATWIIFIALAATAPRADVVGLSSGVSPWTYLLNQLQLIPHYLRLAIWPRGLIAFYGWPQPLTLADVWVEALLLLALLAATMVALVRYPKLGFIGVWFFVTLAPASSVVPVSTEVGAERRMYLPLMAVVLTLVLIAGWIGARLPRQTEQQPGSRRSLTLGLIALAVVSMALGAATFLRNQEYASTLDLAGTIVERRPTSVAHHILGQQLAVANQHAAAIAELRLAAPGDSKARFILGLELFATGQWTEAIDELNQFVQTAGLPERPVPHWLEPSTAEVINARVIMGRAAAQLGRTAFVIDQAQRILAVDRANADAYALLGDAHLAARELAEAESAYRQYLKVRPADSQALTRLGAVLMMSNKPADGLDAFRRAASADPNNGDARRNLALALLEAGDAAAATPHAEAAASLLPQDAVAFEVLGRVRAAQGRTAEAMQSLQRALQLDPSDQEARDELARLSSSGSSRRPRF